MDMVDILNMVDSVDMVKMQKNFVFFTLLLDNSGSMHKVVCVSMVHMANMVDMLDNVNMVEMESIEMMHVQKTFCYLNLLLDNSGWTRLTC